jgi:hypothetical protein
MVESGDRIEIRIHVISSEPIVTWQVHVLAAETGSEKASFTQSVWNGVIVCKEDLARTQLQHVPKLSSRGRARLTVLSLCDGARALADVERETFDRHPDLFRTADEAALFVAEVVTRYSV